MSVRAAAAAVTLEITLRADAPCALALFWEDPGGGSSRFGEVKPGATMQLNTYASHTWQLVDEERHKVVQRVVANNDAVQRHTIDHTCAVPRQRTSQAPDMRQAGHCDGIAVLQFRANPSQHPQPGRTMAAQGAQGTEDHSTPEAKPPPAARQGAVSAEALQPTPGVPAHGPDWQQIQMQPTLRMMDAQQPYAEGAKGTLYAAFNTDGSFGVFNEWGSVTGQRFKKHEYSPRAPVSAGKYKSWADARAAALDWLLAGGTTPQRAAVQLARDAERADEQRRDAVRAAEQRSTPERQTDVHTGPVQAGSVRAGPTCVRPRMLPRWMVARQAAEAAQAVQGPAASQAVVKLQRWGRRVGLRQRWRDVVAQAQAQAAEAAERAARTAELRRSQPGKRSAAEKARRNKLQKQRKRQRAQAASQAEAAVTSAAGDQSEPTDETGATTADGSSAEPLSLCAPQSASAALQEAALREAALRARLAGQKQLNGAIRKRSERESRLAFGRAKRKLQREAAEAKQAKSKQRNVKQLRGVAGSARRTKAALKQQKKARNKQQREKQREEAQPSA
jgi:hypothetical protein